MRRNPWVTLMRCRADLTFAQLHYNKNPSPWNDIYLTRAAKTYAEIISVLGWSVVKRSMETEDASLRRIRQLPKPDRKQSDA